MILILDENTQISRDELAYLTSCSLGMTIQEIKSSSVESRALCPSLAFMSYLKKISRHLGIKLKLKCNIEIHLCLHIHLLKKGMRY